MAFGLKIALKHETNTQRKSIFTNLKKKIKKYPPPKKKTIKIEFMTLIVN